MEDKKKEIKEQEMENKKEQEPAPFDVEEKSTSDLEEWIEEQGIQLRY